jgi:transcription elongation GreA/GreB family factor
LHPRLIVRPYRDRGGPRRTAQRIAAELVRAAAEHDAHTLVLGLPERIGPTGAGVISRVTRTAPPDIQLAFAVPTVQPGRPRLGSVDVPAARLLQVPQPPGRIALSPLGRRILADREYRLRALALPRQRAALKTGDTERRLDGYERLVAEQRRLRRLLATAASTTDRPADPRIAEIGDHVTLRAEDGRRRRILLVEDFEASFNPLGVSVDSPLGRALLGRHVGERVSLPDGRRVDPPAGTARILTCRRG